MDFQTELDEILLSDNVVEDFNKAYNQNKEFKAWLIERLPQIEDCANQQQNNPWHVYNVLNHILHSVESINKFTKDLPLTERRLLSYVMLFHDIGKPAKHITRIKNGVEIDSFFNHNLESARIVNMSIRNFGFDEDEIIKIYTLVVKHDIFMNLCDSEHFEKGKKLVTYEYIEKLIKEFSSIGDGIEVLKELVMVGRADNYAQNPQMTQNSLKLLDTFDKMIQDIENGIEME